MNVGYGTVIKDCSIGEDAVIWHHCNLYRCRIGKNCKIASFVEIGEGVIIGDNCKIEAFVFLCKGVTLGNGVFIGPHVTFCNDPYPTICDKWTIKEIVVKNGASIGANCTILPGVVIGENALIGAGSTIADNVPANSIVYGQKASQRRKRDER